MIGVGVTAVMLAVEVFEVGLNTLIKAAINKGMSDFVFIVYSNAFAIAFVLLPSSLIYYRERSRPPLTLSIICRIFLLGLMACCVLTCMITGIRYSSPTLASAITNLTPAFTFILAVISRERPKCLENKAGHGVGGYWVLVLSVAFRSIVHAWACHKKGPVFVSMFKPLGIVIAIAMGVAFLGDTLYLGSVVGAVIIAFGFYSVIWGQALEEKKIVEDKGIDSFKSSSSKAPLLQNRSIEV